ncbi:MAG TPA: rhomboid family intramembrane serine protease [Pirellulales bacterium]|nr:rhomboid family intramembrane serine protease [Pirellulales bacterium]
MTASRVHYDTHTGFPFLYRTPDAKSRAVLIPWNTDAPIYHPPWATGGLILINMVVFVALLASGASAEAIEPWMLVYGDGLHPLQWLTSIFLHAGFFHLLGNMVFLWAFGLVVEGKLGWLRFTAVYLGIGVAQSALEQLCMLGAESGGSLGASAAIYGLLAIAMVWAPSNELSCILLVGIRPISFDISILALAFIYLGIEIVTAAVDGFGWGSSLLHLSGAALGFGVGVWMLKTDRVDCEGWDLFAVLAGREGEKTKKRKRRKTAKAKDESAAGEQAAVQRDAAQGEILRLLKEGHARGAHALNRKMTQTDADWQLPEGDSRELTRKLLESEAWPEAVESMVDHLRRFPDAVRVRLKLAQVLVRNERRPAQALRVLDKLPADSLPESLQPVRVKLIDEATRLREQAPVELACEDW